MHGKDVLIHWEDFGSRNAAALLQRYRGLGPTFNDDIQSTAAVTLACVLGACRRAAVPQLADQVFLFAGAGQAALGIARLLTTALADEVRSLRQDTDAVYPMCATYAMYARCYMPDSAGKCSLRIFLPWLWAEEARWLKAPCVSWGSPVHTWLPGLASSQVGLAWHQHPDHTAGYKRLATLHASHSGHSCGTVRTGVRVAAGADRRRGTEPDMAV